MRDNCEREILQYRQAGPLFCSSWFLGPDLEGVIVRSLSAKFSRYLRKVDQVTLLRSPNSQDVCVLQTPKTTPLCSRSVRISANPFFGFWRFTTFPRGAMRVTVVGVIRMMSWFPMWIDALPVVLCCLVTSFMQSIWIISSSSVDSPQYVLCFQRSGLTSFMQSGLSSMFFVSNVL